MCALAAMTLAAQSKEAKPAAKAKSKAAAAPAMEMMKPSPEQVKLNKWLNGTWMGEAKFDPGPMMPQGGETKGREVFHPGPGGFSVFGDYVQTSPTPDFHGFAILMYDPGKKQYVGYWTDSMAPMVMMLSGNYQGNDLVLSGDMEMMGQPMKFTWKYSDITPASFTFTEESSAGGQPARRDMVVKYTKLTKAAAKPAAGQ